jgi:hypothetical protein
MSRLGIAMAADTALTERLPRDPNDPRTVERVRVLTGSRKLFAIPHLRAGLAVWGLGRLPGGVATQFWVEDFIEKNADQIKLSDLVDELRTILESTLGGEELPGMLGFHVAGYISVQDSLVPAFIEVRNADPPYREGGPQHPFEVYPNLQESLVDVSQGPRVWTGGDLRLYNAIAPAIERALSSVRLENDRSVPDASLWAHREYLASMIRLASDLHGTAGVWRTIGADVSTLSIEPDGVFSHLP